VLVAGERLLVVATRAGLGRLVGESAEHPDGQSFVDVGSTTP